MQQTETQTAAITLLSQLRAYAGYALWCNQRIVEWLRTKPTKAIEQPVASSFPSIKDTLVHISDVQCFWMECLHDRQQTPTQRKESFKGTVEEVFEGLLKQSEELVTYTNALTEWQMQQMHVFKIPNRIEAAPAAFDILQHIVTHDCYHRGQVITIGHQLGFKDAPMTTYNNYIISTGKVPAIS